MVDHLRLLMTKSYGGCFNNAWEHREAGPSVSVRTQIETGHVPHGGLHFINVYAHNGQHSHLIFTADKLQRVKSPQEWRLQWHSSADVQKKPLWKFLRYWIKLISNSCLFSPFFLSLSVPLFPLPTRLPLPLWFSLPPPYHFLSSDFCFLTCIAHQ